MLALVSEFERTMRSVSLIFLMLLLCVSLGACVIQFIQRSLKPYHCALVVKYSRE